MPEEFKVCMLAKKKPMSMRHDAAWHILVVSGFIDYIDQRSSKALVALRKHMFDYKLPTVVFNVLLSLVTDPWDTGVADYKSHCAWILRVVHYGSNEVQCMTSMRDLVWPRKYTSLSMCGYIHAES